VGCQFGVLEGREELQDVPQQFEESGLLLGGGWVVRVVRVSVVAEGVDVGDGANDDGHAADFEGEGVEKAPVGPEEFDFGGDGEVVDDPVKEVAGAVGDVEEGEEALFTVEEVLLDHVIFVDRLEESEKFAGLADGFWVRLTVPKRLKYM
jgi:hypothetical protein